MSVTPRLPDRPAAMNDVAYLHAASRPEAIPPPVSPLVAYALGGLHRCWLPEHGRWSHRYHLDGRTPPNQSVPRSDLYYSLNVVLGLARVAGAGHGHDLPALFRALCAALPGQRVRNGAWGMAMWAGAVLGCDAPGVVLDQVRPLRADPRRAADWTAQDCGLLLSGLAAQLPADPAWRAAAETLCRTLLDEFQAGSGLFRDARRGPRRHFASFASQVYACLALYQFGEATGAAAPVAAADACIRRLLALQGPRGEWPWFYDPRRGRVLDAYQVYSVHQHGMAPAVLHHAAAHGIPGARDAMRRGVEWLFGANEMGVSMLVPSLGLMHRSQVRQGWANRRFGRLTRAAAVAAGVARPGLDGRARLRLTQEMRSYEYGWLLWSFGARTDLPEITAHPGFAKATP